MMKHTIRCYGENTSDHWDVDIYHDFIINPEIMASFLNFAYSLGPESDKSYDAIKEGNEIKYIKRKQQERNNK